jgi:hypothetical protein
MLESGQILSVKTFGGEVVRRQLRRISGDIAEVTTPEEWEAAAKEGR